MENKNVVVYDLEGTILTQTGVIIGEDLPARVYPVRVPFIELSFNEMKYDEQILIRIDVTTEPHTPVFEPIVRELTDAEQLAIAEAKLRELGVTVCR